MCMVGHLCTLLTSIANHCGGCLGQRVGVAVVVPCGELVECGELFHCLLMFSTPLAPCLNLIEPLVTHFCPLSSANPKNSSNTSLYIHSTTVLLALSLHSLSPFLANEFHPLQPNYTGGSPLSCILT